MRQKLLKVISILFLILVFLGCEISPIKVDNGVSDDGILDYTINLPDEPTVTTQARMPSAEEQSCLENVILTSLQYAVNDMQEALLRAMLEYSKENPSRNEYDTLREVDYYTCNGMSISGWYHIPFDNDFSDLGQTSPMDISFSSDNMKGKVTLSDNGTIVAVAISDYASSENETTHIENGYVYMNTGRYLTHVAMTADFIDSTGSHSLYYRQQPEYSEDMEIIDENALCILDDNNLDYVLFGLDSSIPTYPSDTEEREPTAEESNLKSAIGYSLTQALGEADTVLQAAIDEALDSNDPDISYIKGQTEVIGTIDTNNENWIADIKSFSIGNGDYRLYGSAYILESDLTDNTFPASPYTCTLHIEKYNAANGEDNALITSGKFTSDKEGRTASFSLTATVNDDDIPHTWIVEMIQTSESSFDGIEILDDEYLIPFFRNTEGSVSVPVLP